MEWDSVFEGVPNLTNASLRGRPAVEMSRHEDDEVGVGAAPFPSVRQQAHADD